MTFQRSYEGKLWRDYYGNLRVVVVDDENGAGFDTDLPVVTREQQKRLVEGTRVKVTTTVTVMGIEPTEPEARP